MDLNKMGKFIAKKRKEKGLTQEDLGNKLGILGKSVSKWERGINAPDIAILGELSSILEVSVNDILNGEESTIESKTKKSFIEENKKLLSNINFYTKKYATKAKKRMLAIIIALLMIFFALFTINNYNKCQVYKFVNTDELGISGYVIFNQDSKIIMIDSIDITSEKENRFNKVKDVTIHVKADDKNLTTIQLESNELINYGFHAAMSKIRVNIEDSKNVEENILNSKTVNNLTLLIEYIDYDNNKKMLSIKLQ